MERRELLYGSAGALAIAVAGCTGRAQEGDDTDENETADDEETADDNSENDTDSTDEEATEDETTDDEKADDDDEDGPEADYDGDVEGISGFDVDEFSIGGDALTVDWMVCEEGVLVVNAVVDTSRTDLLGEIESISGEDMESVPVEDIESISGEDVESLSPEDLESISGENLESLPVEDLESLPMEEIESIPVDTAESIDDVEQFSTDIREIRVTVCDETSTEILSVTIDVQWLLEFVADLIDEAELTERTLETTEYAG